MRNQIDQQLDAFFADDNVRWLIASARENRALTIAFPKEINVSNLFAWLLAPGEGHGLGDLPIKELLLRAWEACETEDQVDRVLGRFRPSLVTNLTFAEAVVVREYSAQTDAGRVDIIVVDPQNRLILAIENKYGAAQSDGQLTKYANALEAKIPEGDDWQLVPVLLDYDAESTPADARWLKLDYQWVIRLIKTQLDLALTSPEAAATLRQFAEHLEDEGQVPYARLTDAESVEKVILVAHKHPAVLQKMKALRTLSPIKAVDELLSRYRAPVAVEYIRHRKLWNHVLHIGARADLLVPVKTVFPSVLWDFESSSCVSYFSLPAWLGCWTAPDADDPNWPIWAALHEPTKADNKVFTVTGDFFPDRCKAGLTNDLSRRALALRHRNGMKAQRPNATAIRVGYWRCTTKEEAVDKLLTLMRSIDSAMFDSGP